MTRMCVELLGWGCLRAAGIGSSAPSRIQHHDLLNHGEVLSKLLERRIHVFHQQ
eukprot:01620_2